MTIPRRASIQFIPCHRVLRRFFSSPDWISPMLLSSIPASAGRIHAPSFLDGTDADLALYRRISLALRAHPPSSLFRYLLPEGKHLMQMGDQKNWVWARLMRHVRARYSDLPTSGPVAGNGVVLNSVPERIVYEALHAVIPPDAALDLEPAIGGLARNQNFFPISESGLPVRCVTWKSWGPVVLTVSLETPGKNIFSSNSTKDWVIIQHIKSYRRSGISITS